MGDSPQRGAAGRAAGGACHHAGSGPRAGRQNKRPFGWRPATASNWWRPSRSCTIPSPPFTTPPAIFGSSNLRSSMPACSRTCPSSPRGVSAVPSSKIVETHLSTRHDGHYDRRVEWLTEVGAAARARPGARRRADRRSAAADPGPRYHRRRPVRIEHRAAFEFRRCRVAATRTPAACSGAGTTFCTTSPVRLRFSLCAPADRAASSPDAGTVWDQPGRLGAGSSRNSDQLRCDLFAPSAAASAIRTRPLPSG